MRFAKKHPERSKNMSNPEERKLILLAVWPEPGTILRGLNDEPVEIRTQIRFGRVMKWTTAIVDDEGMGWYLSLASHGLKCMIDMEHHNRITDHVIELVVLRHAIGSKSLICGVPHEQN